jgi:hypothetical protein
MPLHHRHMRPADLTAILFAAAFLALFLFVRTPNFLRLNGNENAWLVIGSVILSFFGLGTLLHTLLQVCRHQLRAHRPKRG